MFVLDVPYLFGFLNRQIGISLSISSTVLLYLSVFKIVTVIVTCSS